MLSRPLLRAIELVRRHNGHAVPRSGALLHRIVRRGLPDRAEVELLPGVRVELDLRQPVELQSWWQGHRYEHPITGRLDEWAGSATAYFDVGANYGFFSLRAVKAGCPAVHAFEPNPDLHARLSDTRDRNALHALHCHHLGLADHAGQLELHIRDAELGHSSFGPRTWADGRRVTVPVTTFDAWCRTAGLALPATPSWVAKVDVEGYELSVLDGMAEALDGRAFLALVVELNDLTLRSCGASAEAVIERLAGAGYGLLEDPGSDAIRNACFVPTPVRTPEPRR